MVMGSEMSGGVSNVTISNSIAQNTNAGYRIKTGRGRGGYIRNIKYQNLKMDSVGEVITVDIYR